MTDARKLAELRRESLALRIEFMRATVDTALTFARLARLDFESGETGHAEQLLAQARKTAESIGAVTDQLPAAAQIQIREHIDALTSAIQDAHGSKSNP